MDIKTIIGNILGRKIHKDRSKNSLNPQAYPGQTNVYSPFRPYADQYTQGRYPVGINIVQKRKQKLEERK